MQEHMNNHIYSLRLNGVWILFKLSNIPESMLMFSVNVHLLHYWQLKI